MNNMIVRFFLHPPKPTRTNSMFELLKDCKVCVKINASCIGHMHVTGVDEALKSQFIGTIDAKHRQVIAVRRDPLKKIEYIPFEWNHVSAHVFCDVALWSPQIGEVMRGVVRIAKPEGIFVQLSDTSGVLCWCPNGYAGDFPVSESGHKRSRDSDDWKLGTHYIRLNHTTVFVRIEHFNINSTDINSLAIMGTVVKVEQ